MQTPCDAEDEIEDKEVDGGWRGQLSQGAEHVLACVLYLHLELDRQNAEGEEAGVTNVEQGLVVGRSCKWKAGPVTVGLVLGV